MVALALYTFNFAHPGRLLAGSSEKRLESETSLPTGTQAEKGDVASRSV
jgi:hypothetical protein